MTTFERPSQLSTFAKKDEYVKIAKNNKLDETSIDQIDGLINLLHEAERITGKTDVMNMTGRV